VPANLASVLDKLPYNRLSGDVVPETAVPVAVSEMATSRLLCLMNGEDLGCHRYAYRLRGHLTPMIDPDRGYLSRRGHDRLYQEGDKTRGHERSCPDQVEVEPRLTEKCEA
jgi:hypothetical protein